MNLEYPLIEEGFGTATAIVDLHEKKAVSKKNARSGRATDMADTEKCPKPSGRLGSELSVCSTARIDPEMLSHRLQRNLSVALRPNGCTVKTGECEIVVESMPYVCECVAEAIISRQDRLSI